MSGRAVCFDLDDTLYDYHRYARSGLRAAADRLESIFGERFHRELLELYFEDGVTEGTFDALCRRHDLPTGVVDELVEAYHGADDPLTPYPEVRGVLDALEPAYRLGVVTAGRGGRRKLARLDLAGYFDAVLVTSEVECDKEDPAVFRRILAALSVPPGRATYVGDDPRVDFLAPNDLGMHTVRVRRGRFSTLDSPGERYAPDQEVTTLAGLPDFVRGRHQAGPNAPGV